MKKIETKSLVLLKHHLEAVRMPTLHGECEKVAPRCATDNVDHLSYLLQLCELELIERERRAAERRLKAAIEDRGGASRRPWRLDGGGGTPDPDPRRRQRR